MRHVLFLLEDLLVASLDEVGLERHRNLNVDVVIDVFLRDQLNFSVILRDLVVREQVKQVEAENCVLPLRLADDVLKFVVIALEHADVALELLNVLLFDREESSELVYFTCLGKDKEVWLTTSLRGNLSL